MQGHNQKQMRRKDKEILDFCEIQKIILSEFTLKLAMISDNEPFVVPLTYSYEANSESEIKNTEANASNLGFFYFHSAKQGRKVKSFSENKNVCFLIEGPSSLVVEDVACRFTMKYKTVIGYGDIEIVNDENEKIQGMNSIMNYVKKINKIADHPIDHEFNSARMAAVNIYKINIKSISGKFSPAD